MRWILFFVLVLAIIGGGLKLAGQQLPIIDYPFFGGPMGQPRYDVQQPDLDLP